MQDYKSSRLFDLFGNWRVSWHKRIALGFFRGPKKRRTMGGIKSGGGGGSSAARNRSFGWLAQSAPPHIYTCAHTHCVYICCCVCFQIASLLFTSQQPALLFLFSVAPDRAPDLWFINYAIKKERERNGIHPRSFPMQLYQTNSTQRRFKWVLIYTAALCRKSWNFILIFELLFSTTFSSKTKN